MLQKLIQDSKLAEMKKNDGISQQIYILNMITVLNWAIVIYNLN